MSTARASSVFLSSYRNTVFNQSAGVFSYDCFLNTSKGDPFGRSISRIVHNREYPKGVGVGRLGTSLCPGRNGTETRAFSSIIMLKFVTRAACVMRRLYATFNIIVCGYDWCRVLKHFPKSYNIFSCRTRLSK